MIRTFYLKTMISGITAVVMMLPLRTDAQSAEQLIEQARLKIDQVNQYEAKGKMKTNVTFLKVPVANVTIYFSKPNQLRIKSEKGVSFVPKGAVSINLGEVLSAKDFTILDAGDDRVGPIPVKVVKLLPNDDNSDLVLSTLYIDPVKALVMRARTTTRENGTYELDMTYGKYSEYGLPDKIFFSFNTKDYKLPKGVTFDFDDGSAAKQPVEKGKPKKGRAEIYISSYKINQPLPSGIFTSTGAR